MKRLIFVLLLFSFEFKAQNIEYARQVIDTLSCSYFCGRGALNNGEKKAAKYISSQFEKIGLKKINNSFFQEFNYSINTFPGKVNIEIDGVEFTPAEDYLVDPKSIKTKGEFDLVYINQQSSISLKQLKKRIKKGHFLHKIVVVDKTLLKQQDWKIYFNTNKLNASGYIYLEDKKLTHHLSQDVGSIVTLHFLKDKFPLGKKKIKIEIDQEFKNKQISQNVIGKIVGSDYPDSVIIFSAHYDHLGMMGKDVFFPGANDNASGIAMLLNLAEHYALKEKPKKTIVFMAFGAEEVGILGSKYFTESPMFPITSINFLVNLDIMGTGDEGIQVVNGSVYQSHFDKLVEVNNKHKLLKQVKIRGKAANSDHYWFSEKNVPSFFIYTLGGITAYHDVYDISKTLPLTKFEDCFKLFTLFVSEL